MCQSMPKAGSSSASGRGTVRFYTALGLTVSDELDMQPRTTLSQPLCGPPGSKFAWVYLYGSLI
jgi:hypothetical protein